LTMTFTFRAFYDLSVEVPFREVFIHIPQIHFKVLQGAYSA
jgi:hypothetical protein